MTKRPRPTVTIHEKPPADAYQVQTNVQWAKVADRARANLGKYIVVYPLSRSAAYCASSEFKPGRRHYSAALTFQVFTKDGEYGAWVRCDYANAK